MTFWGTLAVLWALLSPQLGAAILPPETLRDAVREVFDEDPSRSDRRVDDYVGDVRRATAWERAPTIYQPSVAYFKQHFDGLDPDRHHDFPDIRRLEPTSISQLAVAAPVFAGRPVLVSGFLDGDPTVVTSGDPDTLSVAFAIHDPAVANVIILARVPVDGYPTLANGDRVSVSGLVIGDGAARYVNDRLTRVVYIAGSSIAPSTRIELRPWGADGKRG